MSTPEYKCELLNIKMSTVELMWIVEYKYESRIAIYYFWILNSQFLNVFKSMCWTHESQSLNFVQTSNHTKVLITKFNTINFFVSKREAHLEPFSETAKYLRWSNCLNNQRLFDVWHDSDIREPALSLQKWHEG